MSFGFGLGFGFGAGQGGFDLASLWANGESATLYENDDLTALYLQDYGATNVSSDAETVALSLDRAQTGKLSSAAYIATQTDINSGSATESGSWTESGGVVTAGGTASASDYVDFELSEALVSGEFYKFTFSNNITVGTAYLDLGSSTARIAGFGGLATQFVLSAVNTEDYIRVGRWSGAAAGTVGPIALRRAGGNHAIQSTTSAEPAWKTGGFLRHDGFDDGQLTSILCGSGGSTLAQMVTLPTAAASTKCLAGLSGSSTARFYLAQLANGKLAAGVGNQTTSTIFGGDDISGETGVAVLTEDGSTVNLYWNNVLIYTGAQSGAPSTSVPFARGYLNNNGTPAIHCAIDEYKFLHLDYAATAAQVANITAKWS